MEAIIKNTKRVFRKNFGKIITITQIPNLIEVQKQSYESNFLQMHLPSNQRANNKGLQSALNSIFPIKSNSGNAEIEFIKYEIEPPKYGYLECKYKGISYSASLKITLRLIIWEIDNATKVKEMKSIKEQDVYIGDVPLMTENGTFIINGIERVIVSQMHRSPGIFFDHDKGKTYSSNKLLYLARIIPYRGSWLDFEFDGKDLLYFRLDKKRKLYLTTLLRALGINTYDILNYYYETTTYTKSDSKWTVNFIPELVSMKKLEQDLVNADTGEVLFKANQKINLRLAKKIIQGNQINVLVDDSDLLGKYLAEDINDSNGNNIANIGVEITTSLLDLIKENNINKINVLLTHQNCGPYIRNTIFADKNTTQEEALADILKILRPGEPISYEVSKSILNNMFFNHNRYDLSEVGRVKLNAKLNLKIPETTTTLTIEDIKKSIKLLIEIRDGKRQVDDIDNLSNRRIRSAGELVENQFKLGLIRMQKAILERMNSIDVDNLMPYDLLNSKILFSILKEFFGTSPLSQFMDQTNPLSEITHKRRISALGPGGVNKDRAGVEVRDVHPTHYGKICPIETPEGQNIGLINSLTTYAKINKHGFIETPYRKVINGCVTDEFIYLSAVEEENYKIGQSTIKIGANKKILEEKVICRCNGEFTPVPVNEIDFIDINPVQIVSVGSALIPFLENNDTTRALMGSNMQRQAVPLIRSESPYVGTGVEEVVARDSGLNIIAKNDGIVDYVDGNKIIILTSEQPSLMDVYKLIKFQRSNHNTFVNQIPCINIGEKVKKGQILAQGHSMDNGELSLGKNILIAFLSWRGYTFEDAIVVSERVVQKDLFSSIHIEEYEIIARDTKLGPEEITRDIPNVYEENLSNLDETGIINIGTYVKAGDILVGKVTPKNEVPVTPEEKLLRAIFGDKAADVSDSSLYVPPGTSGVVVEVRIFSRKGMVKDQRSLLIEQNMINNLIKEKESELKIINGFIFKYLKNLLLNNSLSLNKKIIDDNLLNFTPQDQWWDFIVDNEPINKRIQNLKKNYENTIKEINERFNQKIETIQSEDDLPQGALKIVKVFIATKHKLQPGDKMAGRHGNKGVVAKIIPQEDMPFLEDGTPVDIILNTLSLSARMNIGQVLETHLGWASYGLGKKISKMLDEYSLNTESLTNIKNFVKKIYSNDNLEENIIDNLSDNEFISLCNTIRSGVHFASPVFDGAKISDIKEMLKLADLDSTGQVPLINGLTGEYLDRKATVGYKYLFKLHHLVDDKVHARSIGPYSLVTQQPLGGKSHFGGQRFGEMECWALEAYGAAYTLIEMLTVKADDVNGRIKIYESIVSGNNNFEHGIPESFNVMLKELKSLCLNIRLQKY